MPLIKHYRWKYNENEQHSLYIGPLIIESHFRGCNTWGLEIGTDEGLIGISHWDIYWLGKNWDDKWHTLLKIVIMGYVNSVTLRIGKPTLTLIFTRRCFKRHLDATLKLCQRDDT